MDGAFAEEDGELVESLVLGLGVLGDFDELLLPEVDDLEDLGGVDCGVLLDSHGDVLELLEHQVVGLLLLFVLLGHLLNILLL